MTPEDVRAIVLDQIGEQWSRSNLHGCDLRECLVDPPQKLTLINATDEAETNGWLVLREDPAGGAGYGVVFHEASGQFGLTQFADSYRPCLIGIYGQFFDAFDAM